MNGCEYLWPSRVHASPHLSTRQYARIRRDWVFSIGLEASGYGTHSMRRTKVDQIYKKTGNLRAVQLLLGHTKMDSTVRYLGVDIEAALTLSEGVDLYPSLRLAPVVLAGLYRKVYTASVSLCRFQNLSLIFAPVILTGQCCPASVKRHRLVRGGNLVLSFRRRESWRDDIRCQMLDDGIPRHVR